MPFMKQSRNPIKRKAGPAQLSYRGHLLRISLPLFREVRQLTFNIRYLPKENNPGDKGSI